MEKFLSKYLLLVTLLIGTASTAFAIDPPYGSNLNYAMNGSTLVLTSPNLSESATIYSSAFLNRTDITAVVFPDNLSEIGSCAFSGCTALTEIVIPLSVTSIGVEAFKGCSSLASVLCRPYSAPALGADAFAGCAESLKICVSALGEYNDQNNNKHNWYIYPPELCFLDEYDDQSTAGNKISYFRTAKNSSIDIFRTLRKAGCFNTLTLPFSVAISGSPLDGDNVEVYEFVGAKVEAGTLQLNISKVTSGTLTAGKPYLIQWKNTGEVLEHMRFTVITWDEDQTASPSGSGDVTLQGFYGMTHISDAIEGTQHLNLFLQGNNTLYWPSDGGDENAKMLGFRAYFQIAGSSVANSPVYRGMPATLQIVSSSADVEATQAEQLAPRKELRNGQIVIIRNGETFLLNGQKL